MIGETLDGKYAMVAVLGSGAMGEVFEAHHIATGRKVAIKVLRGLLTQDASLVTRFQREARASGTIASRHIAEVLDAGVDKEKNAPYLVMELLLGEDLDSLVKRLGALRPSLALRIAGQVLAGLDRAHAANVIHRDIKPANLYLAKTDDGRTRTVKIVDFGIAKVKDNLAASQDVALTQTSALLGSPLYMSPEQARASKHVDARADLWSIATVLHQLLTGRAPHGGCESLTELLLAICTQVAAPVQQTAPWVSPAIAAIVTRALDMDIERRFASAAEMLSAIATLEPDWQTIDEEMLGPLTDEEKAVVAPRAIIASASTAALPGAETIAEPSSASSERAASSPAGTGTEGAYTRDGDGVRKGKSRSLALAVGACAVIAAVGVSWRALRAEPASSPRSEGLVATPMAPPIASALPPAANVEADAAAPPVASTSSSAELPRPAKKASSPIGAPRPSAKPAIVPAAPAPSSGISRDFN